MPTNFRGGKALLGDTHNREGGSPCDEAQMELFLRIFVHCLQSNVRGTTSAATMVNALKPTVDVTELLTVPTGKMSTIAVRSFRIFHYISFCRPMATEFRNKFQHNISVMENIVRQHACFDLEG